MAPFQGEKQFVISPILLQLFWYGHFTNHRVILMIKMHSWIDHHMINYEDLNLRIYPFSMGITTVYPLKKRMEKGYFSEHKG